MYALDAKTGKIVWEFYLVPKVEGDPVRGPDQSCASADQITRARLVEVEQRIANLTALKAELQRMVTGCSHGRVDQCRVIEALAISGNANVPSRSKGFVFKKQGQLVKL